MRYYFYIYSAILIILFLRGRKHRITADFIQYIYKIIENFQMGLKIF